MYEINLDEFKKLSWKERISILDKLNAEVEELKVKVNKDEGIAAHLQRIKPSPYRYEWEEKAKFVIAMERAHSSSSTNF